MNHAILSGTSSSGHQWASKKMFSRQGEPSNATFRYPTVLEFHYNFWHWYIRETNFNNLDRWVLHNLAMAVYLTLKSGDSFHWDHNENARGAQCGVSQLTSDVLGITYHGEELVIFMYPYRTFDISWQWFLPHTLHLLHLFLDCPVFSPSKVLESIEKIQAAVSTEYT